MKLVSKWLLASGALLVMFGFFLPIITISHQSAEKISSSLSKIAGFPYWFFLYLVPIGAFAIFLLALIPVEGKKMKTVFLIGEIVGLCIISMLLLGTTLYFLVMPQQLSLGLLPSGSQIDDFNIWPAFGLLVLLPGIGVAILGVLAYFFPAQQKSKPTIPEPIQSPNEIMPALKDVYLEATKGVLDGKKIPVNKDDFSIGRGRDNSLQLSDTKVSRLHARLRYAQGSWFIQDQNSKIGILVNGKSIKAGRLTAGDSIQIGEDTFIFHA